VKTDNDCCRSGFVRIWKRRETIIASLSGQFHKENIGEPSVEDLKIKEPFRTAHSQKVNCRDFGSLGQPWDLSQSDSFLEVTAFCRIWSEG
jgi:hypothetical protein